jgi:hypothetical protein
VYCAQNSITDPLSLNNGLKEGQIVNQTTLEKAWLWIESRLRTHAVSEEDVLQTLKSGFLQTDTGKSLAPLFVETMMRSIQPLAGLKTERLRELVEVICHLPPERWADSFGEDVNFPRGRNGEGVQGFIQSQLTLSRTVRDQNIAAGELLDDDTWKALRDFTQQTRQYIRSSSEAELNVILRQLEDVVHIRPSPQEAKLLMDDFVEAMNEPRPNERQRWPKNFPATVQKLTEQLKAVEIVDNRPDRTWLEEIVALGALSPVSLKDIGGAVNSMVLTAHDFVFGVTTEPASAEVQNTSESQLLSAMQEIERVSSFYNEVVTSGPGVPKGFAASVLYALNVLDTVGLLSVADKVKPYLPAVPLAAPAIQPQPEEAHVSPASLKAKVVDLEAAVNDFIASIKSQTGTGSAEKISNDPGLAQSPASATPFEMLEQLAQSASDVLGKIDRVLRFPEASAASEEIPLDPLNAAERGDPQEEKEDPVYGSTVKSTPTPTWRELLTPIIKPVVTQLASLLNDFGGYAVGVAASGYQLARNNPGTTAAVGLVGVGGFLTMLGTYLTFFKEQLPEQPAADIEPDNTLPPLENGAAPTQQQIDDELESDEGTSLVTRPSVVSTPIPTTDWQQTAAGLNTTVDTTVTTEPGEVTTPIESTTLPQEQIDEETTVETVDSVPDYLPVIETAESHQQRIDDEIERIVDMPLAKGLPPLSESILELMYESSDEEVLLQEVAALLKQHGTKNPEQSYSEQIQEVLAEDSVPEEVVAQPSASRTKREADYAGGNVAAVANAQPADVEENISDDEAELNDYLVKMEALQRPDIDTVQGIDSDTAADPEIAAAMEVVRVVRSRRSAIYTDASRADGDRQLAARYATALRQSITFSQLFDSLKIDVPVHSTFGQCWQNYLKAIKDPFFTDWAAEVGLDLKTVKVDVAESQLTGTVNGTTKTFSLTDNSGWAYHAPLILDAAKVVDPLYDQVPYPSSDGKIPVRLVGGFYGEGFHLGQIQSIDRANDLDRQEGFSAVLPDDLLRPQEPRSEAILKREKRHLGDRYDHHNLIIALEELIKGKSEDALVDLRDTRIPIDRDSSFAAKNPVDAQRMVSVQTFISDNPWVVPKNVADIRNLINVLSFPLPRSPEFENYRGAFGDPTSLTPAQRALIRDTALRISGRFTGEGLLEYLLRHLPVQSPVQGLTMALGNSRAQALGTQLVTNLGFISTPYTATGLVLAALLLDLDPTVGQKRNHIAGYDLEKDTNWGKKPSAVVTDLESHLIKGGKADAKTASVAAHHALSAFAPEFLVKGIPDNLVCGSHTWAMLRISVARIEQLSPGASAKMSFQDIMQYGDLEPITVGQDIAVQSLSVDPLIDWAVANGVIAKSASDTYSKQQLTIVSEKFQDYRAKLAQARDYLTEPPPSREALALNELGQMFGEGLPYKELNLRRTGSPMPQEAYSMLDLYITGQLLPGRWVSSDSKLPIQSFESKFGQLKNVDSLFENKINSYFDNLRTGSRSVLTYLFSQLPLEDRKSLEYGNQKYYSLRGETNVDIHQQTPKMLEDAKGRHGLLIESEYKGTKTYYEVFPSSVQIRKRILTSPLILGGELKTRRSGTDPSGYIELQKAISQPFDFEAYQNGTPPRDGVRSDVIIEEITPLRQQAILYPPGYDFDATPNVLASDFRVEHIAEVAVEEHFVTGKEELRNLARGTTLSEERAQYTSKVMDFLSSLVPFKSCLDNISNNNIGGAVFDCTLDAAGFVIPGVGVAGKAAQIAKSGIKIGSKIAKITRMVSGNLVSNANPIDGLGGLLRGGVNTVGKLGAAGYRAVEYGVGQLKNLFGATKAIDHADLLKRADFAEGVIKNTDTIGQASPISALYKDGNWYAFDVARNRPYGAPLENFTPDSSVPLELTTFSDGTTALTPSRLFTDEAHTIQRSSGFDVVAGNNVYRFDPEHPDVLNDITSPAYFKEAEGFEDVCSFGNRPRRSPQTCFSKIVTAGGTRVKKTAQSISHKRLYPTQAVPGQTRMVIHERRLFMVVDNGNTQKLIPSPLSEPLQFRSQTTGSIINDKHFGLPNKEVNADLELKTRVVKIDGIVHGFDDHRDARGFLIDYNHQSTGVKSYLVVESDTGLYYYSEYDATTANNLILRKIDTLYSNSLGNGLIRAHDQLKDQYLIAAGTVINNDFVALPPLDSLYMDLILKKGFLRKDIDDLKSKIALLSEQKQREFVLAVWNRGKNRNVEIAAKTIRVEPLQKPPGFDILLEADKNKIYANGAKAKVDQQFEATGLRSANKVDTNNPADLQRQVLTRPLVIWEYSRIGAPNYADQILRTGAGNCDQMAWTASKIINESGGTATVWGMPGAHTFTVVGVPRGTVVKTVDFSEPAFKDAWVVDPWAEISCPASEYVMRLDLQMNLWEAEGKMLLMTDWLSPNPAQGWKSPTDPLWMAQIIHGEKILN